MFVANAGQWMRGRERLESVLDDRIERLESSGTEDRSSVRTAAAAVSILVDTLQLGAFLEDVVLDRKPRYLLRFRTVAGSRLARFGRDVLLKVYGDRPRGEGPMLSAWHSDGLTVPESLSGELDGSSWLVLQYLDLDPVTLDAGDPARALAVTDELASAGPVMHRPDPDVRPFLRCLDRVMVPRWDGAVAVLQAAGHPVPGHWRSRAVRAYGEAPRVPLHGDLGLPNVGRGRDGSLVIYDPSALLGPVGFDAVRWAARLAGPSLPVRDLLMAWHRREDVVLADVEDLLAAECVLEAGAAVVTTDRDRAAGRVRALLLEAERVFGRE